MTWRRDWYVGGGIFLKPGNESDRDEWDMLELSSGCASDSTSFFCVFSVHKIGSASREFLVHVNAMLFFLEPITRTHDAFLPDYFLERLCVSITRGSNILWPP